MGTPATAFAAVIHTAVLWFGVLWVSALAISRVYMFHSAFLAIMQARENDNTILATCQANPRFQAAMAHRSSACEDALHDGRENPWLKALDAALSAPTLCGHEACADILARLCARGGWTFVGCVVLAALFSPHILVPFFQRSRQWIAADPPPPPPRYAELGSLKCM